MTLNQKQEDYLLAEIKKEYKFRNSCFKDANKSKLFRYKIEGMLRVIYIADCHVWFYILTELENWLDEDAVPDDDLEIDFATEALREVSEMIEFYN